MLRARRIGCRDLLGALRRLTLLKTIDPNHT